MLSLLVSSLNHLVQISLFSQGFGLRAYVEVFQTAEVCLVILEESLHNLSNLQFRENFRERPNQIRFFPLGCQFEIRTIVAKGEISSVSNCNISVIFALSRSDAMLACRQICLLPGMAFLAQDKCHRAMLMSER